MNMITLGVCRAELARAVLNHIDHLFTNICLQIWVVLKGQLRNKAVPLPDAADFDADAADFRWRDADAVYFRWRDADADAVANFDADAVTLPTFIVDTVTDDTVTDDTTVTGDVNVSWS